MRESFDIKNQKKCNYLQLWIKGSSKILYYIEQITDFNMKSFKCDQEYLIVFLFTLPEYILNLRTFTDKIL